MKVLLTAEMLVLWVQMTAAKTAVKMAVLMVRLMVVTKAVLSEL